MSKKPLQVNPIKLSQPMGATLAFLGIKGAMPLMHGAQGCASFTKVFFTRHFNEPIAIQTTAVNDITAVLDGGHKQIYEAMENILAKNTPTLLGLFSTGLTETKGDDLRGAASMLSIPNVYVNTSDYEGGIESGWSLSVKAIIEQLIEPKTQTNPKKALILPNVNLTPIEVEKLKEFVSEFGFETHALPDLSTSLDGFLGEKQGALSSGGIELDTIKNLGDTGVVISVGTSMKPASDAFKAINKNVVDINVNGLMGLQDVDNFVKLLMEAGGKPSEKIKRWRSRLQDMMLDSHFGIGKTKFLVAGEPDSVYGICKALSEVGGVVESAIVSLENGLDIAAHEVIVGDFEDVERNMHKCDVLISNFHGERIAHKYHKPLVVRGFPNYEQIGVSLQNDILYEGTCYFLKEIANGLPHQNS